MVVPISDQLPAGPWAPPGSSELFTNAQYSVLDSEAEDVFDDLVSEVAQRLGTSQAQISIVTPQRVWLKAALSGQGNSYRPGDTFCAQVASDGQILVVPDARRSPRFAAHPAVTARGGVRFYAGIPLITRDGTVLGVLCVWDERPRRVVPEDIAALEHIARDALALLELRQVTQRLVSAQSLLAASGTVMKMILAADALLDILDTLARAMEASVPATRCSILLLDGSVLHHGAGPSLPRSYLDAIDGVRIGPAVGSCGTAAYTRSTVIVADIATDPLWANHREYALAAGLRACWSVPMLGPEQQVLGTFALYYDTIRSPSYEELTDLSRWVNLAELAIIRSREVASLRLAATVDPLTGLINRAEALNRLQQATADAGTGLAVLFVDLDQFKFVNDTLGHAAGDEYLKAAAIRLTDCLGPDDTVARFGGDEFLVLCPGSGCAEQARGFGRRIITAMAEPLHVHGSTVALSASVGIALSPAQSGPGTADLIAEADLAMYSAKRSGRNNVVVFDADLRRQAAHRLRLEADLSHALTQDELDCQYQPIVDLPTGQVIGFEALLRWHSPTRGSVPPLDFIPTAEDSGIICEIGEFVLRRACRQLATWTHGGAPSSLRMWVNISPRQLEEAHFADTIQAILAEAGLPAGQLGVEVTESTLIQDAGLAWTCLTQLRDLGVTVAVDDFGTGYSSLAHLKNLPVDVLKIDKGFISDMNSSKADAGIVAAILALADTAGLRVTAEGIETMEQRHTLQNMGCATGQGYLFSRPLTAPQLTDLLRADTTPMLPIGS